MLPFCLSAEEKREEELGLLNNSLVAPAPRGLHSDVSRAGVRESAGHRNHPAIQGTPVSTPIFCSDATTLGPSGIPFPMRSRTIASLFSP